MSDDSSAKARENCRVLGHVSHLSIVMDPVSIRHSEGKRFTKRSFPADAPTGSRNIIFSMEKGRCVGGFELFRARP